MRTPFLHWSGSGAGRSLGIGRRFGEGARQPYAYGWRRRGRVVECLNANASSIALYGQSLVEENVKEYAKVRSK